MDLVYTLVLVVIGAAMITILFSIRHAFQKTQVWRDYREPIIRFSSEVVYKLSEVEGLCEHDPERLADDYNRRRNRVCFELKALMEQGRVVIPDRSKASSSDGLDPFGNQRPPALECIQSAIDIVNALNHRQFAFNKDATKDAEDVQYKSIHLALTHIYGTDQVDKEQLSENFEGWSCQRGIVLSKRKFVREIQKLVDIKDWMGMVSKYTPMK